MTDKINGKFYPLTPTIASQLRQAKLTAAEWRIWSYLVAIDPYGDRYLDLDTLTVMTECDCSKATFYRAIAKFQKLELFDFQDKGWSFKNETGVSKLQRQSQNCNASLKNETSFSKMRQVSQICENQPPEPLSEEASSPPQTIQTLKTKKTLSEERERDVDFCLNEIPEIDTPEESRSDSPLESLHEREKLLEFGRSKANQLPVTPQLIEKWIVDNIDWIKQEFDKVHPKEAPPRVKDSGSAAASADEFFEELHPAVKEGLSSGEISKLDPAYSGLFDSQGNWWKIDDWLARDESQSATAMAAAKAAKAALRQRFSAAKRGE